ncbi:MarR family winged helix-turn-helix transcriptional regulator [Paenibacillus polymyxa]|uniref:MarR family winged helix-turn-helix transcriptional regulator n=1 Tax=Paenibacillus polymyxa TaxID=1406 RepID=UPI00058A4C19|nr:MarR family transcriptional regulator [Paenibacillus polymyxa]AJE53724.1 MarR family transcriptional regulator [Paenibacillus polymyxa]QOH62344.1 MarR family transcriptional regulator [Paenibacillus polymyxa]
MKYNEVKNGPREKLEIELGEQLNALISASHALNVRAAAKFDSSLQPAAFHIVRWLYSYGPTNAATLAESTAMDRSSVSRLVKQLQSLGYLNREASQSDGRGIVLSLTEHGQQQLIDALKEKESVFYERILDWKDTELHDFIQMLRQFNGLN